MPCSCSHSQLSQASAEIRAGLENQLRRAIKITSTEERKSPLKSGCNYNSLAGRGLRSPSCWRRPCSPPGAPGICRSFGARAKVPEPRRFHTAAQIIPWIGATAKFQPREGFLRSLPGEGSAGRALTDRRSCSTHQDKGMLLNPLEDTGIRLLPYYIAIYYFFKGYRAWNKMGVCQRFVPTPLQRVLQSSVCPAPVCPH